MGGRLAWMALVCLGLGGGCGASAQGGASHPRLALLPVSWRTHDTLPGLDEREALAEGLRAEEAVTLLEPDPDPPCDAEDDECAGRVGRRVGADEVVLATMAALGETVLARVSVLDVGRGTRDETRQRAITPATPARVRGALSELGRRIAGRFAPEGEEEAYEQWWVWTLAGAVLAAGATATALGVAAAQAQGPDVVITPP